MKKNKNEIYTLVDEEYLSKFSFNHQAFMKDYYYKFYYKFCQHYHRKPLSQDEFYTNMHRRRIRLYQLCCPCCGAIYVMPTDKRLHGTNGFNYCPHCGFPIYYKENKAFGKKMYVCSNDSEVCGFVSNNMKGGKTSIKKCPHCRDGYLFIKKMKNKEVYFLGCSNYDNKKTKCEYSESLDYQN